MKSKKFDEIKEFSYGGKFVPLETAEEANIFREFVLLNYKREHWMHATEFYKEENKILEIAAKGGFK